MANEKKDPLAALPKRAGVTPPPSVVAVPVAAEKKPAPQEKPAASSAAPSKFAQSFWTFASVLSLTVNLILVLILLAVFFVLKNQRIDVLSLAPNLLGGLFSNFEKMDEAHITKTIPVEAQIPVQFDLQLNQQTNVVLSENVVIPNALVTVNTGGLNINNARASIILPQGTSLPVLLNLTVPVNTSIPVALNVAVDIPLNETQLHDPFVGLQEVVKPLYCAVQVNAKNSQGEAICK